MSDLAAARRYQHAHLTIMERSAAALATIWNAAPPLDDTQLARWLAYATPIVAAARVQAAALGAAFVATTAGPPSTPVDAPGLATGLRGGVALDEIYARPTITARARIAEGRSYLDAMDGAFARMDATVRADVQLAGRAGTHEAMRHTPGVVGYRRVTDGKACRLCVLASTQRYTLEHLMPIHNRCGCTVVPIIGARDPGQVIDHELLSAMKADPALGTDGHRMTIDEIRTRYREEVAVHEHGELGPVLGVRGQAFTGLDDIAA